MGKGEEEEEDTDKHGKMPHLIKHYSTPLGCHSRKYTFVGHGRKRRVGTTRSLQAAPRGIMATEESAGMIELESTTLVVCIYFGGVGVGGRNGIYGGFI